MTPEQFQQANTTFKPPADLDESQCGTIHAYKGQVERGSVEGADIVVVAWRPNDTDLFRLLHGGLVYLTCIGGLPPHMITTTFEEATQPP